MRKRRRKVNWFPTLGLEQGVASTADVSGFQFFIPYASGTADIQTGIFPVTYDSPESQAISSVDTPLVDIVGSEYILKRLVGKVHLHLDQAIASTTTNPTCLLVGAGFFVARAEDAPNQASPVGYFFESILAQNNNYSPLAKPTIREPWVWRRTWILGANNTTFKAAPGTTAAACYDPTNEFASGLGDGPHIDARTARRVGNDDRLWFAVSCVSYPVDYTVTTFQDATLTGYLDIRVLGTLVKAHNRSVF